MRALPEHALLLLFLAACAPSEQDAKASKPEAASSRRPSGVADHRSFLRGQPRSALGPHRAWFDATRGTLRVRQSGPGHLYLDFHAPPGERGIERKLWTLSLAAPEGEALAAGLYANASRQPHAGIAHLGFSSENPCSAHSRGWFEIFDLEPGPDPNSIGRLALNFEHRCKTDDTGVTIGQVRFRSEHPVDAGWTPAAVWLYRGSLAKGKQLPARYLGQPAYRIELVEERPGQLGFAVEEKGGERWTLSFATGRGEPLELGMYSRAASPEAPVVDRPVLGLGLAGEDCRGSVRWFSIHEIRWKAGGKLDRFAATFERWCKDEDEGTRGQLAWDSDTPLHYDLVPAGTHPPSGG